MSHCLQYGAPFRTQSPTFQTVAAQLLLNPRYLDKATNEWKDGESLFLQCQIWRQAAENVTFDVVV